MEAENKVVVLPSAENELDKFASLACFIRPEQPDSDVPVRWITPDEINVAQSNGQYLSNTGLLGDDEYGSFLLVRDVSYKNAGIYVCEVMETLDCTDFPQFATIELVLRCEFTTHAPTAKVYGRGVSIYSLYMNYT